MELAERRRTFARLQALPALALLVLALVVGAAMLRLEPRSSGYPIGLEYVALFLLTLSGVLITQVHLATERQVVRYAGGPLVVRSRSSHLAALLLASVLATVGSGFMAAAFVALVPESFLIALETVAIGGAVVGVVSTGILAGRLGKREPSVVVSDEGIFSPAVMRRPVAWDDIESVPIAASGTPLLIGLRARNAGGNHRSFWSRPLSGIATHAVYGRAGDATQADLLLAIAHYRPALVDALTLPPAEGLRSAMSPARTI